MTKKLIEVEKISLCKDSLDLVNTQNIVYQLSKNTKLKINYEETENIHEIIDYFRCNKRVLARLNYDQDTYPESVEFMTLE